MDTHGAATAEAHAGHESSVPETGLRFEKTELTYFVDDDRYCGKAIGGGLAIMFLISFSLFTGVCIWMLQNSPHGHDPQAGIGLDAGSEHH